MSLTSFLDRKDIKAKFREIFAKPEFKITTPISAPPLTKNYSLVGTAFDYLLRFYLQRLNPLAQAKYWIAEAALGCEELQSNPVAFRQAKETARAARQNYTTYLNNGQITDDLLCSTILLAQIDPVFRRGVIDPDFGKVDTSDIADLRNLINLVRPETFQTKTLCLLDPTFGPASTLVGGADVDLVLDEAIIDIKTTKDSLFRREYFNQIVGYYILYRLGGINGAPNNHKISHIGIYSSRYGILHTFAISDIASERIFDTFSQWFVEQAQNTFGTNFERL